MADDMQWEDVENVVLINMRGKSAMQCISYLTKLMIRVIMFLHYRKYMSKETVRKIIND
jgi:hypothetical protein